MNTDRLPKKYAGTEYEKWKSNKRGRGVSTKKRLVTEIVQSTAWLSKSDKFLERETERLTRMGVEHEIRESGGKAAIFSKVNQERWL